MPRRPLTKHQDLRPDHKYNSLKVAKFVNYVMQDGKKATARKIVYDAFDILKDEHKVDDPVQTFNDALQNIGPMMEVRSRRIGGANYQVPREVGSRRRQALAMRWMVEIIRDRGGRTTAAVLADELLAASKGEGEAVRKKENMHRMAEANKAFAHFSW